jgi:hypothetical protein
MIRLSGFRKIKWQILLSISSLVFIILFTVIISLFHLIENPIASFLLLTDTSSVLYLLSILSQNQTAIIAIVIISVCVVFVSRGAWMENGIKAIVCLLLVFSLGIFWIPFYPSDANHTNLLYLLSSISQGLSAAFTLIITITLIASQILVKHGSDTLDRIFSFWVVMYIVFFIISIILPLILILKDNYNNNFEILNWIKISLIFTVICLILLIPYMFWFKEKIKPENIVKDYIKRLERLWVR